MSSKSSPAKRRHDAQRPRTGTNQSGFDTGFETGRSAAWLDRTDNQPVLMPSEVLDARRRVRPIRRGWCTKLVGRAAFLLVLAYCSCSSGRRRFSCYVTSIHGKLIINTIDDDHHVLDGRTAPEQPDPQWDQAIQHKFERPIADAIADLSWRHQVEEGHNDDDLRNDMVELRDCGSASSSTRAHFAQQQPRLATTNRRGSYTSLMLAS